MARRKGNEIELKNGEIIELLDQELLFVNHYLADPKRNATEAAIKAGYKESTATPQASRLLSRVNISKYIKDQTDELLDALGADKERLLKEWISLGFSNIKDYLNDDYSLKELSQISRRASAAIESIQIDEKVLMQDDDSKGTVIDRKIKFKLHDKIKPLTALSEMKGVITKSEPGVTINNINNINPVYNQLNNLYNTKPK